MKERLTGAIILVALIVLLVPELLTGPIRTRAAPAPSSTAAASSVARAARAQAPLRTYTLTLGATPPAPEGLTPPAQPAATPEDPASHAETPRLSAESTEADSTLQGAKSPADRVVREARSSGTSGGWVVQLGSFASHANADRLARKLERRGFRMSVTPARAGSRVLWRVRAGPAHGRAGAQRLAARLRALGHRGELLPLR